MLDLVRPSGLSVVAAITCNVSRLQSDKLCLANILKDGRF